MQVLFLGRAPRTKKTLLDFLKWCRVTRPPLVFRGLTGSQRTPRFWGVTYKLSTSVSSMYVRPEKISIFWKNGKIVISVKIRNFSRSRMTKRISPLESSREI